MARLTRPAVRAPDGAAIASWIKRAVPRFLGGAWIAGLIFCLAAAEQLGGAAKTQDALRAAASNRDVAASWPKWVWPFIIALGVVFALLVLRRMYSVVEELRERRVEREGQTHPQVNDKHEADAQALVAFALAAVFAWVFWQVAYAYPLYRDWNAFEPAAICHWLAIGAAVLALGASARAIGDARLGWKRASGVRIQLILLGLLIVGFFIVPVTASQVTDVLRAWGDGPLSRVAFGIAAALLLGTVVRASAQRLLIPRTWSKRRRCLTSCAAAFAFAVAVLMMVLWGATLGAAGLAVAIGLSGLLTKWGTPEGARQDPDTANRLNRLAGTLGVMPLGILFAGLASALTDTLLLPSPASPEDRWLVAATAVVGLAFSLVVALVRQPPNESEDPVPADPPDAARASGGVSPSVERRPRRNWLGLFALAAVGFLACVLTLTAASGGTTGDVASVALALAAFVTASGRLTHRGAPQFLAASGAVAGAAVAVYLDPVDAPRAFGAVGIGLVGATGILLTVHLLGTLGARRVPRRALAQPWLPSYLPVVGILAVWVGVAWVSGPGTLHQARTVDAAKAPSTLDQAVHAWLTRQMTVAPGEDPPTRVPMLLVAASGGGSKAAYWTDLVLDCLASDVAPTPDADECPSAAGTGPQRLRHLFLTSSVSGGSVGVYHFMRHRSEAANGEAWVSDSAGKEVLSPIVAWGIFHDLPAFMTGAKLDPSRCRAKASPGEQSGDCRVHADRALVQEAAVAGFDHDLVPTDPSNVLTAGAGDGPITVFNAALDGADGRVLISPVSLSPPRVAGCETPWTGDPAAGSMDGHDLLNANEETEPSKASAARTEPRVFEAQEPFYDVPLVTAALLTARFPVVAPAARLGTKSVDPGVRGCKKPPKTLPPATLRDGGYVENSGLLTVIEILPTIRAAIDDWKPPDDLRKPESVPIIVASVDDDPVIVDGDPDLGRVPRKSLGISAQSGPGYFTRLARDRLESCQYHGVHYARISPKPHVGAHAATGWEVSVTARREDLIPALRRAKTSNAPQTLAAGGDDAGILLQRVRDLLDGPGPISCPSG